MKRQSPNIALRILVFSPLVTILLLNSCSKKEEKIISPEEKAFISLVQGNWTVCQFDKFYDNTNHYVFYRLDSVYFNTTNSLGETQSESYSKDDPVICTLPYIEVIQEWIINKSTDSLFLETQDLCGGSNYYNIYFENIFYQKEAEFFGGTLPSYYNANMVLLNQNEQIIINNLRLYDNTHYYGESMRIEYYANNGDHNILLRYP